MAIGDLLEALGDRAIGALMFVFAVPNVLPMPPGVSAILGAPLIFLSAQLMLGRGPWLPAVVARRSLSREVFATDIRTVQELPGHSDVSTTMIYTHVLKAAAAGTASPLGAIAT